MTISTPSSSASAPRISYLDSVRGLAALAVVLYHALGWKWGETLKFHVVSLVFNGSDAVSLFFVLSGLVLSWKYFQPNEQLEIDGTHYQEYIINRLVRLYLPFVVTILAMYVLYHHQRDIGLFLKEFVTNQHHWMEEAVLIRGKHDTYTPGWTLEVEMVASLLLPVLVLVLRKSRKFFLLLLAVFVVLGPPWVTAQLFHFMLGMLLTYFFHPIAAYNLRRSRFYHFRYLLYLLAFGLFSIRHLTRIFPLGESANFWMGFLRIDLFHLTGIGSFGLLAYIINSPRLQGWLTVRPLLFLGRISYSLYLVHWYLVAEVMSHWDQYAAPFSSTTRAFVVILPCLVVATLLTATVFNILVERPAIRLGKRLAARFRPASAPLPTPA